jgi:hypothetical protein
VFGALDDNIDGKLTKEEFRNDPRFKPVVHYLPMVDADKDGALSKAEMNDRHADDAEDARQRRSRCSEGRRSHGRDDPAGRVSLGSG